MTGRRLKACVITGVVVPHDAISNITRQQADALAGVADVRVFAHGCQVPDSRVTEVGDPLALAAHDHFRAADLVVFNFGIAYPLFDAIHLAPRTATVVVCYYGVTPPQLLPPDRRGVIHESYKQASNILAADRVLVTSDHIRKDLALVGVPDDRVRMVRLGVAFAPAGERPARAAGDPLRLLYVGRFVPAKGVRDLVQAVAAVSGNLRLDLAGSGRWADEAYLAEVRAAGEAALGDRFRVHLDATDEELAGLYAAADAVVLPSYHEGFGVPIVEALAAGCFPVTSDAGACPETAGGLGLVYPVGDVPALADRLRTLAAAVAAGGFPVNGRVVPAAEWRARAADRAAEFSRAAYEARFRAAVLSGVNGPPTAAREYLADAHRKALNLTPVPADPLAGLVGKLNALLAETAAAGPVPATAPPAAPAVAPTESAAGEPVSPAPPPRRGLLTRGRGLVRRARPAVYRVPVLGHAIRYVKRVVFLPWNFHKHYQQSAAFQAEGAARPAGADGGRAGRGQGLTAAVRRDAAAAAVEQLAGVAAEVRGLGDRYAGCYDRIAEQLRARGRPSGSWPGPATGWPSWRPPSGRWPRSWPPCGTRSPGRRGTWTRPWRTTWATCRPTRSRAGTRRNLQPRWVSWTASSITRSGRGRRPGRCWCRPGGPPAG
ncbi:MAG: glycosyltransferase family 4 protein [Gemmataceae bacterium]